MNRDDLLNTANNLKGHLMNRDDLLNTANNLKGHLMNRDDLLNTANSLINGDRAQDYGDALENHERIAAGWNVIATAALQNDGRITAAHVALMMDWVKTARLCNKITHEDSWVDKAAYSALGGEMSGK